MNKTIKFIGSIGVCALLVASLVTTFLTSSKTPHKQYDLMVEASNLTQECFDAIKEYKITNGIEISEDDRFNSGMIGVDHSKITTTDGELDAKITSTNPSFAALYIKYFSKANLKENDEVAVQFSGSFPCLNIACLCAIKTYKLKPVIMASIGASTYGANQDNYNFIDMYHTLVTANLLNYNLDIVSGGSHDDLGPEYFDFVKEDTLNRISSYGYEYLQIDNYTDNVQYRVDYIKQKLPNLKMFINVGGHTISTGKGSLDLLTNETIVGYNKGYYKPNIHDGNANIGLIETYLNKGIDVVHILKIKQLCINEGLTYNPSKMPNIGSENVYYDISYNLTFPLISLSITTVCLVIYYIDKKRINKIK